jgi:uncharacterized ferritin-like protein (DUF455 family)
VTELRFADALAVPRPDTVERWAWDYVHATTLAGKLHPGPVPDSWEEAPPPRRLDVPGRPAELRVVEKAGKTRGLASAHGRARVLHTFLHHELQAAELMLWALLAFPETPRAFRTGLVHIARDEIRHMHMYAGALAQLGHDVGDFPVRDWFWERVPACGSPTAFVAVMGLGFESANLDHSAAFAARFRAAGDETSARLQEIVGKEEIAHVRFAVTWFETFTGGLEFQAWVRALPSPLSPVLMKGASLARAARERAGQPGPFVDALEAWRFVP